MNGEPSRPDEGAPDTPGDYKTLAVRQRREEAERAAATGSAADARYQQQPAHFLKVLLRGHSLLEWIDLGFAFALVLIGTFYTFYAAKQWEAMKLALRKTDAAIELNRQALDLSRRETVAAEQSAAAAGQSIALGKQALDTSARSFRVDQRPYLIVEAPVFTASSLPLAASHSILANAVFKNVGKSPAVGIRLFRHLALVSGHPTDGAAERIFGDAKPASNASVPQAGHDLAPGEEMFTTGQDLRELSASELLALQRAEMAILFVGGVEYRDGFGSTYSTEFCYSYAGTDPATWGICPIHNTIR
jgi:hypothetical protein